MSSLRIGELIARGGEASDLEERLGRGAMTGTPPVAGDDAGWAYETTARRGGAFSRAAPGIDLVSALVHPLREVQRRFPGTLLLGRAASRLWLSDAGSRNGTEVNYDPLSGEHELADGDVVTLGHFVSLHTPARPRTMLRAVC